MKTVEEKKEFANCIKFDELFRHAEIFTGMALTFSKPELVEKRGIVSFRFQSNNIAPACGVFGKIFEYCKVENFSNEVFEDKETGQLVYTVCVHISYEHHNGGSNGMWLFTGRFQNGEWIFQDTEPRKQ